MKQYIILFSVIVIITILNIYQCSYLEKTSKYMVTDLRDIECSVKRGDFVSATKATEELKSTWNSIKSGWDSFGEHDDIGTIENDIDSLIIFIVGEETTNALEKISSIDFRLNHVIESEKLKIHNVL